MAETTAILICVTLLSCITIISGDGRWSRQIPSTGFTPPSGTGNDWVPLAQHCPTCRPGERANGARVLNFGPIPSHHQAPFTSNIFGNNENNQPQQFALVGEPFSAPRFMLPQHQSQMLQQHHMQQQQQQQQQQHQQSHNMQHQHIQQQPQHQMQLPQQSLIQQQQQPHILQAQPHNLHPQPHHHNQQQIQLPQLHVQPQSQQLQYQQQSLNLPHFLSHIPHEQPSHFQFHQLPQPDHQFVNEKSNPTDTPPFQFIQSQRPQVEPLIQEAPVVNNLQDEKHFNTIKDNTGKPENNQEEEIQLVYVPLDTLWQQQNNQNFQNNRYNVIPHPVNPSQINDFYTSLPTTTTTTTKPIRKRPTTSTTTTTTAIPITTTRNDYYRVTTLKPKPKPKPHQPPLAMFMLNDVNHAEVSVNDVLTVLKDANSIAVLDAPSKNAPKVFIGPSGMQIPTGYSKFDLPYLSGIDHNRYERRVENLPFFVAPQSYRAPDGFAKIPLPAPHVGSVLVNAAIHIENIDAQTQKYYTTPKQTPVKISNHNYVTQFNENYNYPQSTSLPVTEPTDRYKVNQQQFISTSPRNYYSSNDEDIIYGRLSSTSPSPLHNDETNKRNKQPIDHSHITHTNVKSVLRTSTVSNPYIVNEDFLNLGKVNQNTERPNNHREKFEAEQEQKYHSNSYVQVQPSVYTETPINHNNVHTFNVQSQRPITQTQRPIHQTQRPIQQSSRAQEEYRMKTYFKEQEAFKNRPQLQFQSTTGRILPESHSQSHSSEIILSTPSSSPQSVEQQNYESYTSPVFELSSKSSSKEPEYKYRFSSQTTVPQQEEQTQLPFYSESEKPETNVKETTNKKFSFITSVKSGYGITSLPISQDDILATDFPIQNKNVESNQFRQAHKIESQPQYQYTAIENIRKENQKDSSYLEADDQSHYHLPSELPPISPNLPGLVNSLMDNLDNDEQEEKTTTQAIPRRTVSRGRRPQTVRTSTSTNTPATETSTVRKTTQRGRRPYTSRPTYNPSTRVPSVRNPNRVRYNPSNEDRQALRRRPVTKKKVVEDNIEYQRDVLNQNYPVIKPVQATTFESVTEYPISNEHQTENQQSTLQDDFNPIENIQIIKNEPLILTTTEQTKIALFNGLIEPMQIPQENVDAKQEEDILYPQYYGEKQSDKTTISISKQKVRPIYIPSTTTTTTTTTIATPTTDSHKSRRPSFVKRPVRPVYTTIAPTSTTLISDQEKFTVRPRTRPESNSNNPRVTKIRGRIRKPVVTTSTTSSPVDDVNYNEKYNRFNNYNEDYHTDSPIRVTVSSSQSRVSFKFVIFL